MKTTDLQEYIVDLIAEDMDLGEDAIRSITTYKEAGVLTNDAGMVIIDATGTRFQVTIAEVGK